MSLLLFLYAFLWSACPLLGSQSMDYPEELRVVKPGAWTVIYAKNTAPFDLIDFNINRAILTYLSKKYEKIMKWLVIEAEMIGKDFVKMTLYAFINGKPHKTTVTLPATVAVRIKNISTSVPSAPKKILFLNQTYRYVGPFKSPKKQLSKVLVSKKITGFKQQPNTQEKSAPPTYGWRVTVYGQKPLTCSGNPASFFSKDTVCAPSPPKNKLSTDETRALKSLVEIIETVTTTFVKHNRVTHFSCNKPIARIGLNVICDIIDLRFKKRHRWVDAKVFIKLLKHISSQKEVYEKKIETFRLPYAGDFVVYTTDLADELLQKIEAPKKNKTPVQVLYKQILKESNLINNETDLEAACSRIINSLYSFCYAVLNRTSQEQQQQWLAQTLLRAKQDLPSMVLKFKLSSYDVRCNGIKQLKKVRVESVLKTLKEKNSPKRPQPTTAPTPKETKKTVLKNKSTPDEPTPPFLSPIKAKDKCIEQTACLDCIDLSFDENKALRSKLPKGNRWLVLGAKTKHVPQQTTPGPGPTSSPQKAACIELTLYPLDGQQTILDPTDKHNQLLSDQYVSVTLPSDTWLYVSPHTKDYKAPFQKTNCYYLGQKVARLDDFIKSPGANDLPWFVVTSFEESEENQGEEGRFYLDGAQKNFQYTLRTKDNKRMTATPQELIPWEMVSIPMKHNAFVDRDKEPDHTPYVLVMWLYPSFNYLETDNNRFVCENVDKNLDDNAFFFQVFQFLRYVEWDFDKTKNFNAKLNVLKRNTLEKMDMSSLNKGENVTAFIKTAKVPDNHILNVSRRFWDPFRKLKNLLLRHKKLPKCFTFHIKPTCGLRRVETDFGKIFSMDGGKTLFYLVYSFRRRTPDNTVPNDFKELIDYFFYEIIAKKFPIVLGNKDRHLKEHETALINQVKTELKEDFDDKASLHSLSNKKKWPMHELFRYQPKLQGEYERPSAYKIFTSDKSPSTTKGRDDVEETPYDEE